MTHLSTASVTWPLTLQNQALSALPFSLQGSAQAGEHPAGWKELRRSKNPVRLPVVFNFRDEVRAVFSGLRGTAKLMAGLLYGSGLRLMECVRLRVKDIDFAYLKITVRDGKGARDRVTMLPVNLAESMQRHLATGSERSTSRIWQRDLGEVHLHPAALDRKCANANRQWAWQSMFFPSSRGGG